MKFVLPYPPQEQQRWPSPLQPQRASASSVPVLPTGHRAAHAWGTCRTPLPRPHFAAATPPASCPPTCPTPTSPASPRSVTTPHLYRRRAWWPRTAAWILHAHTALHACMHAACATALVGVSQQGLPALALHHPSGSLWVLRVEINPTRKGGPGRSLPATSDAPDSASFPVGLRAEEEERGGARRGGDYILCWCDTCMNGHELHQRCACLHMPLPAPVPGAMH